MSKFPYSKKILYLALVILLFAAKAFAEDSYEINLDSSDDIDSFSDDIGSNDETITQVVPVVHFLLPAPPVFLSATVASEPKTEEEIAQALASKDDSHPEYEISFDDGFDESYGFEFIEEPVIVEAKTNEMVREAQSTQEISDAQETQEIQEKPDVQETQNIQSVQDAQEAQGIQAGSDDGIPDTSSNDLEIIAEIKPEPYAEADAIGLEIMPETETEPEAKTESEIDLQANAVAETAEAEPVEESLADDVFDDLGKMFFVSGKTDADGKEGSTSVSTPSFTLPDEMFRESIIMYESTELSQPITLSLSNGRLITLIRDASKKPKLKRTTPVFEWYLAGGLSVSRGTSFGIAGHLGFNFNVSDDFTTGIYAHGEYLPAPLGSTSGMLGGMEIEADFGANLMFPMFRFGPVSIKLGADLGYYMQIIQFNSTISSDTHIGYNGMVIRPMVMFEFYRLFSSPIGLILYYTNTAIVPYSDYNNIGFMVVI